MPFYEYQCASCGHHLEAMQKIAEGPLKKCPECGKSALKRLMSAPVFRLKGGGWYETDFKSDQDNKRNLADKPETEPAKDDKQSKPAADANPAAQTATTPAPAAKPEANLSGKSVDKSRARSQSKAKASKPAKKAVAKAKRRS